MKGFNTWKLALLKWVALPFLFPLSTFAGSQQQGHNHDSNDGDETCQVIMPQEQSLKRLLSVPSRIKEISFTNPIRNVNNIYHFRLAVCVTPDALRQDFQWTGTEEDKSRARTAVRKFWDEVEEKLNQWYRDDVGIQFHLVRNDKLILFTEGSAPLRANGTWRKNIEVINEALGEEKDQYDISILIIPNIGSLRGQADLGSAHSPYVRGRAWAVASATTIAHELGHTFGANHTHERSDANYTEPGQGQSIMSYGTPRDFFSLASIKDMRRLLSNFNYYTDASRRAFVKVNNDSTVMPYVEKITTSAPVLDRTLVKKEYIVTEGSKFQFYLPLKEKTEATCYYSVNPFDFGYYNSSNALQPAYRKTKSNCIMFQPYQKNPSALNSDETSNSRTVYEDYSDAMRVGEYTFAAAANSNSLYDGFTLTLKIVKGNPFAIKSVNGAHETLTNRWIGKDLTIYWEPCKELYGNNSKVRVLLSDDAGQTFKYVLADDLPNNGSCQVTLPYINIGKTSYRNWTFQPNGGCIKVEVKGEAAYDIYPKNVYTATTSQTFSSMWGFDANKGPQVLFRDKQTSSTPPTPYIEVGSLNEVPKAETLIAYKRSNPTTTYPTTFTERAEGSLIRRSWVAIGENSAKFTYTQIIKLPDSITAQDIAQSKAKRISPMAIDLYKHRGQIGYPKAWLKENKRFEEIFQRVFNTTTYEPLTNVEEKDIQSLNEALTALSNIDDNDVIKPEHGRYYKIRSYVRPYGREGYFYMADDDTGVHFVNNEAGATLWKCEVKNGKYYFTSHKNNPLFKDVEGSIASQTFLFDSFTNVGVEFSLERGYSWGALTIVNNDRYCAQVHSKSATFSTVREYPTNPLAYRVNCQDGIMVSTDFQFILDEKVKTEEDPVLATLTTAKKTEVNGVTWYTLEENGGVDVIYVRRKFTPETDGRVKLRVPNTLTIDGQQKAITGIAAKEVSVQSTTSRTRKYTYSLATALIDYDFDLTIPASVTNIRDNALANNNNLYEVAFEQGSSLPTIGTGAFKNSTNMRFSKTLLPLTSTASIGTEAFSGTAIRHLAFSGDVKALSENALSGMSLLEYLDLRKATNTNGKLSAHRNQGKLKGLSKHTLLFANAQMMSDGETVPNTILFNGRSQGQCAHLALYDYELKDEALTTYGISIPNNDTDTDIDNAPFVANKATFDRKFAEGYSTLYLPYSVSLPEGMKAYAFVQKETKENGDMKYSFAPINSTTLVANTPYLIYNSQNGMTLMEAFNAEVSPTNVFSANSKVTVSTNRFVGTTVTLNHEEAITNNTIYTLNSQLQQWQRIFDENGRINHLAVVVPYRAFMLDNVTDIANTRSLSFSIIDDAPTSIRHQKDITERASQIFTIDGRSINKNFQDLPKGLYIINGKKVLIRR